MENSSKVYVSIFKFKISSSQLQISNFHFRISNLKFQISNLKSQISNFKFRVPIVITILLLMGCTNPSHENHAQAVSQYTCSMHPQIVQDKPGQCPICGMDLVKVTKSNEESTDLMLTDSQVRLANVTTQPVTKKPVGQTIVINGSLVVDEEKSEVISSRSAGRIEKLYIKETGQTVRQGQPLYVLYSETLLTLQQEYLLAKDQYALLGKTEKRYKSFLDAAERKLLLYGLTKAQINQLSDQNSIQPRITLQAPASGIVTQIGVSEGQYVGEGAALYKIEDIGSLWVEAELYPNETSLVEVGDQVNVRINGSEGGSIESKITFLSPEIRNNTQITIMRAAIDNPVKKFLPGQHAQVFLTHSSHQAIAIPVDAVIRDEQGGHVYIQSGNNTFRPRMVKTGLESFDQVEITEGLREGDTVAVTGAYLLYSEIILKKGTDPMAGHKH